MCKGVFAVSLINIHGVMNVCLRKTRSKLCGELSMKITKILNSVYTG